MIINATMAINAITRVVEGKSDFVYRPKSLNGLILCRYAYDGKPDCGVGCALAELGMPVNDLQAIDDREQQTQIAVAELPTGWYLTSVARKIFAGFQSLQDSGALTWGDALGRAQEIYVNPNRFDRYGRISE